MPSFTALIGLFVGVAASYSVGVTLGWLLNKTLKIDSRRNAVRVGNDLENRLRTEVRDDISKVILEILERGEEPTLPNVMKVCPMHFRTGRAWVLWQRESHQMLNDILTEDLTVH